MDCIISRGFVAKSLFLFLTLSLPAGVSGYFEFTRRIAHAYDKIQNLYLYDAHRLLQSEARQASGNVAVESAMAALIFAEATTRDEDNFSKKIIAKLKNLSSKISRDTSSTVHHKIAEIEIALYCGLLHLRLNNRLRAASEFLQAYSLSKNAYKAYPHHAVVKLLWGNMLATVGSLPPELLKYLNVVGYSGNVAKGVDLMKESISLIQTNKSYSIYLTRANVLYLISAKQFIDNEEILPAKMGINVLENYVTAIVSAKVLMEQGYNESALSLLQDLKPKEGQCTLYYFYYLHGKALLAAGNKECEQSLLMFIQQYKGKHHLKASYRLLAWHYLLTGELTKADSVMKLVPVVGVTVVGPDQQAAGEAQETMNITLIRSRILFDGGYLDEALEVLLSDSGKKCCNDPVELAEYYYRLGRVYQKKGLIYPALENFDRAFHQHALPAFNRANAALQAALLYEKIGMLSKAKNYFSKCLEMRNFPYQEGIHQKAKAGLIRLGDA